MIAFGADQPDLHAPAQVPPATGAPVRVPTLVVGATWQWEGTSASDGTSVDVADPTRYTIQFQTGRALVIRADCNNVLGSYTVSGSELTIELVPVRSSAAHPTPRPTSSWPVYLRLRRIPSPAASCGSDCRPVA
jgi:hypothetical protein